MKFSASQFIALFVVLFSTLSWGARFAEIDVKGADLYDTIGSDKKVIARLDKGTLIIASSQPTEGYYKVRLRDQSVGWVPAEVLKFGGVVMEAEGKPETNPAMAHGLESHIQMSDRMEQWLLLRDSNINHPFWRR